MMMNVKRREMLVILPVVLLLAAPAFACDIPPHLTFIGVSDPCWTLDRLAAEYMEAEARVALARYVQGRPYAATPFESITLTVEEHPDAFGDGLGNAALGLYRALGNQIEYSIQHERAGPVKVIRHELAHLLELRQQQMFLWNDPREPYSAGWLSFGHGTYEDPLVIAANLMIWWFFNDLDGHPYNPVPPNHLPLFAIGRPSDMYSTRVAACTIISMEAREAR